MCPDVALWQTFLDGSIAPDDRSEAESHLVRCPVCRQRLIALFDARHESAVTENVPASLISRVEALPFKQPGSISLFGSFRPYVPLALAAGIVLAMGLSVMMYRRTEPQRPAELRQSDRATTELSLISPASGAVLTAGKSEFRWADAGAGVRYEFVLTDEKGDIVFQEKPANNSLTLDSTALKLSPQRQYYWTISARLPDGTRRESVVAGFTLK